MLQKHNSAVPVIRLSACSENIFSQNIKGEYGFDEIRRSIIFADPDVEIISALHYRQIWLFLFINYLIKSICRAADVFGFAFFFHADKSLLMVREDLLNIRSKSEIENLISSDIS